MCVYIDMYMWSRFSTVVHDILSHSHPFRDAWVLKRWLLSGSKSKSIVVVS